MPPTDTVAATHATLGRLGALLPVSPQIAHIDVQREAVRRLEDAGYTAAWANEMIGGKDVFTQLAVLLAETTHLVFGTCIANIWARPPQTANAAAATLAQAYPGRFVLGLGVGYPHQAGSVGLDYGKPLTAMRDYVAAMASPTQPATPAAPFATILGANGPRMLALAADIADGAMPAMTPPEFTQSARHALGPDKLLITLLDSTTDHGRPSTIAELVRRHLEASADHVILGLPMGGDFTTGIDHLQHLATALTDIT